MGEKYSLGLEGKLSIMHAFIHSFIFDMPSPGDTVL